MGGGREFNVCLVGYIGEPEGGGRTGGFMAGDVGWRFGLYFDVGAWYSENERDEEKVGEPHLGWR